MTKRIPSSLWTTLEKEKFGATAVAKGKKLILSLRLKEPKICDCLKNDCVASAFFCARLQLETIPMWHFVHK